MFLNIARFSGLIFISGLLFWWSAAYRLRISRYLFSGICTVPPSSRDTSKDLIMLQVSWSHALKIGTPKNSQISKNIIKTSIMDSSFGILIRGTLSGTRRSEASNVDLHKARTLRNSQILLNDFDVLLRRSSSGVVDAWSASKSESRARCLGEAWVKVGERRVPTVHFGKMDEKETKKRGLSGLSSSFQRSFKEVASRVWEQNTADYSVGQEEP